MARDFAKAFYNSKEWEAVRGYIMTRDKYMCQCHKIFGGKSCTEPAEEVHHIKWLTPGNIGDVNVALNEKNLLAVSRDHHFRIHESYRKENHLSKVECGGGYEFDVQGNIVETKSEL